jgi:hypothetical protein
VSTSLRRARRFAALVMTAAVLCVVGCGPDSQRAAGEAFGEAVYQMAMAELQEKLERDLVPPLVASVVGGFAPGGSPAALNGLLVDAWWDDRLQTISSEPEHLRDVFPRSPLTPINSRK